MKTPRKSDQSTQYAQSIQTKQIQTQQMKGESPLNNHSLNNHSIPSRRMFLRGLGGAALALPYLPSLLSTPFAQEPTVQVKPRFLAICNNHGGIWGRNLYPSNDLLTQSMSYACLLYTSPSPRD